MSFATWASLGRLRAADEVWIHCGWLPCLWWAALWGRNVRWVPEACYDPVRLKFHGWKKWFVGPIERWSLRRCAKIIATCEAERDWIKKYLGRCCPSVEVTDIKRFFKLVSGGVESGRVCSPTSHLPPPNSQLTTHNSQLHLLYLGRRHPLKGLEYLETAVSQLNSSNPPPTTPPLLRIVSNAFGEELEKVWDWCDVLVLPTLSDNFGLVIAEALERGKRVITTDGAPAWDTGNTYGGRLTYLSGYRNGTNAQRIGLLRDVIQCCLGDTNYV